MKATIYIRGAHPKKTGGTYADGFLGVKLWDDKENKQYGFIIGHKTLRSLNVRITKGTDQKFDVEAVPLVEGRPPEIQ